MPKIENWYRNGKSVSGNVYGHSTFPDGKFITTSSVASREGTSAVITNSGSRYELGTLHPIYGLADAEETLKPFRDSNGGAATPGAASIQEGPVV